MMSEERIVTHDDLSAEITIEQPEDDTPLEVKPERRRVKTDKRDLPVETLFNWVTRNKVNPQPEFQRFFVWNNVKASRLIESLLTEQTRPVQSAASASTTWTTPKWITPNITGAGVRPSRRTHALHIVTATAPEGAEIERH
jgi:hypothetical protein